MKDPNTIALIVGILYEIAARVIPTVKDYTIVGRAIKWIHKISNFLNVEKS